MGRDLQWLIPAIAIAMITALCATVLKIATGFPGQPSGLTSLKAAIAIVILTIVIDRLTQNLVRTGKDAS